MIVRVTAALLTVSCLACAAPPASDALPRWEVAEPLAAGRSPRGQVQVQVDALLLEVPARGRETVRRGPLTPATLAALLRAPDVTIVQAPTLWALPDQVARVFAGETSAGERARVTLEVLARPDGALNGRIVIAEWLGSDTPERAEVVAEATFEARWREGSPLLVEIPGKKLVASGDVVTDEPRVYLLYVAARGS